MPGIDTITRRQPERFGPLAADEDAVSVLFIEDDPRLAEMYRLKLEVDGYQVTIAGSEEGIDCELPDLIYLDIRAPHRDRVRVLRRLRGDDTTRRVPVVILSDYREQELVEAGAELGMNDYVVRSTSLTSLTQRIDERLGAAY